jgi:hypothetical protein
MRRINAVASLMPDGSDFYVLTNTYFAGSELDDCPHGGRFQNRVLHYSSATGSPG